MREEAKISAVYLANIVDPEAHHGQARQAKPKGKAAPLVRIDAAHTQHIWVHQPARKELYPAALFTHRAARAIANQALNVEFEARLDKRKVSGTKPDCAHRGGKRCSAESS